MEFYQSSEARAEELRRFGVIGLVGIFAQPHRVAAAQRRVWDGRFMNAHEEVAPSLGLPFGHVAEHGHRAILTFASAVAETFKWDL